MTLGVHVRRFDLFSWIEVTIVEFLQHIFLLLIAVLFLLIVVGRTRYFLHMAQQLGYVPREYVAWTRAHREKSFGFSKQKTDWKKPLVMTPRAKRLFGCALGWNGLIMLIPVVTYIFHPPTMMGYVLIATSMVFLAVYAYWQQAYIFLLALYSMQPVERSIHRKFAISASRRIREYKGRGLKVIGITGSYGKTSTKMILYHIIRDFAPTCVSPESYNTPMGLSKVIHDVLREDHRFFIAEMGARYTGEIQELVDLVLPDYGILTNIGPCHLETFGSMDAIVRTKFELADGVAPGRMVINLDSDAAYQEWMRRGSTSVGVSVTGREDALIRAEIERVGAEGSVFCLHLSGGTVSCKTKLLGAHNIVNIAMASAVAEMLGMTPESIARAIEKIPPVEHRLNLISNPNGLIVIDDAFNSNPAGARAALEVLRSFPSGKKVIVTPGMVELGERQVQENHALGMEIARACDLSIFVGEAQTKPLQQGVLEAGVSGHQSYVVDTLDEATALLGKLVGPGDVVLFENDLTDIY